MDSGREREKLKRAKGGARMDVQCSRDVQRELRV